MSITQSISLSATRQRPISELTYPIAANNRCKNTPATLQISDVHFINITGTASGVVPNSTVATLECSAECFNISSSGTSLQPVNGTAKYLCSNLADESTLDFKCTDVAITKG